MSQPLSGQEELSSSGEGAAPKPNLNWVYVVLAVIVLLGLFMRLEAVNKTVVDNPLRADAGDYAMYAYNMHEHGVYSRRAAENGLPAKPDALRAPGYPTMLYMIWGDGEPNGVIKRALYFQAILSTLTLLLIFFLARWVVGDIGALFAAGLAALSPHLINMNVYLLSESLFTFLLMGCLLALVKFLQTYDMKPGHWLLLGGLLACTALVRPTVQYFILLLALFVYFEVRQRDGGRVIGALLLGFFAVFSLWMLRNILAIGALSDSTLTINTLHHGMYPGFMFNGDEKTFGFPYRFDPESGRISESVAGFLSVLFARFMESPMQYIGWYLSKPAYLFQWSIIAGQGDAFVYPTLASPYYVNSFFSVMHTLMKSVHAGLVVMSVFGMVLPWLPRAWFDLSGYKRLALRLLSLLYIYFILVHVVGAPFPRYSIPIRPLTYILAIYCIQIAWQYRHRAMFWKTA